MDNIDESDLKKFNERATVKSVLKGGNQEGRNTIAQEILAQDQYKQQVIDGLLKIRRVKKPVETEDGKVILQEFVRLEDGTGRWFKVSDIPDSKWQELKKGGAINEEGAKDVLTTLNGIANNNVSLSNLTRDQINKLGLEASMAIDSKLRNNKEDYGIDSADDISWIMHDIVNPNVLGGLSKAKNGAMIGELLREINLVGSLDDEEDDNGGLLNYG